MSWIIKRKNPSGNSDYYCVDFGTNSRISYFDSRDSNVYYFSTREQAEEVVLRFSLIPNNDAYRWHIEEIKFPWTSNKSTTS